MKSSLSHFQVLPKIAACLWLTLNSVVTSGASLAAVTYGNAGVTAKLYAGLHWRLIGPFRGGRVLAVAGVPGNPALFYFGAVDGGVWKSDDAGRSWDPIFDREPAASIGALAIAPSNPNVIFVGTGEADMRSDITYGNGMYKTTDAGASWHRIGLTDTRQIARIVIDPRDANRVFVAALGHAYGPNAERGVYRTVDGGASWSKILFINENTGAVDLAMDPGNANHLLAAMWQTRRPPWSIYQPSSGPGSGLFESRDGGTTWHRRGGNGLPSAGLGRMGIAFAPSRPTRVYVIADAANGGLYRSDDGGRTWRLADADPRLWDRGWYFSSVTVDPRNANIVYVSDESLYRSTDSGKSFTAIRGSPDGDDFHALWIDPGNSQRLILGCDQGASVSLNFGRTWSTWYNQPTGQFYHVSTDTKFPFSLYGAQQDNGAVAALSRSAYSSLTFRDWRAVTVAGESDTLVPDQRNANIIYGGRVERYDLTTSQDQVVDPTLAHPTVQWRDQWTLPLAISPADPSALYFGRQVLFRSHDGGRTWSIISPDLTRANPGIPSNLDAKTAADTQGIGPSRGVIYTIAPSPLRSNTLWVGTDDGKIWQTADGGEHWRDVTPVQLTAWSKVAMLEASWFDPDEAYAAIDRHQLDDLQPYLYRTRDGGKTWQPIANGIPTTSYVNAIRSDPQRNGLLYAGSETGPHVSFDDGDHWLSLQLNMPNVSIRDFSVRGDSIASATHGRGLWVLDDIAPLRQLSAEVAASEAWLFAPAPVVRVRPGDDQGERLPPDEPAAQNPPAGAIIDYELHTRPSAEVKLQIFDAGGSLVREWSSTEIAAEPNPNKYPFVSIYVPRKQRLSSDPGLHQFVWDLRYAPIPGLGLHGPMQGQGPWAPPGHYTVRLSVDGHSTTRTLSLVKDPRIGASDADLRAQFTLAMTIERERAHGETSYKAARKALAELRDPAVSKICSREQAAMAAQRLTDIAGAPPPESPENSMGYPEQNLNSIHYQTSALESLESAVESADTAPTPDEQRAFATIDGLLNSMLHRLPSNVCGIAMR